MTEYPNIGQSRKYFIHRAIMRTIKIEDWNPLIDLFQPSDLVLKSTSKDVHFEGYTLVERKDEAYQRRRTVYMSGWKHAET